VLTTELKTYSLAEHLDLPDEEVIHLVALDTVDVPQRADFDRRNANVLAGLALCDDCDGTGNAHFFSYKQCQKCKGAGHV